MFLAAPALSHESDLAGPRTHKEIPATVEKIVSGLMYFKPTTGLRHRAISVNKAERMGLHEAKPGDEVILIVDEGNVLIDLHKKGTEPAGHRLVVGTLNYADPFWEVIELSTPQGKQNFAVDVMAGSKLSILPEGKLVRAELDEDNMVVDIHPTH
jgi:hypothetical protein